MDTVEIVTFDTNFGPVFSEILKKFRIFKMTPEPHRNNGAWLEVRYSPAIMPKHPIVRSGNILMHTWTTPDVQKWYHFVVQNFAPRSRDRSKETRYRFESWTVETGEVGLFCRDDFFYDCVSIFTDFDIIHWIFWSTNGTFKTGYGPVTSLVDCGCCMGRQYRSIITNIQLHRS